MTDANVLVNLMHVQRLGLLSRIPDHEFVVAEHVREEITVSEQRALLDAALSEGWLKLHSIREWNALAAFADLVTRLGRGESACIAIAAEQGWYIASDERRRFVREVEARIGVDRIITTADLFVLAIRAGVISIEEADADKRTLDGLRFRMPFNSFAELVG